jgi:hypothetical protein
MLRLISGFEQFKLVVFIRPIVPAFKARKMAWTCLLHSPTATKRKRRDKDEKHNPEPKGSCRVKWFAPQTSVNENLEKIK